MVDSREKAINNFLDYAIIMDANFAPKILIDSFTSFIWTERYLGYGDFELTMLVDEKIVKEIRLNDYVGIKESDVIMILETMTLEASDEGDVLTISGRSLESILDRRIIWGEFTAKKSEKLQNSIQKMLEQNVINPRIEARKLPVIFEASTDEKILELSEEIKMEGDNLYEAIIGLCSAHQLAFKIRLNAKKEMVFQLYFGEDRSTTQSENPIVIFSDSYENLLSSNFIQSETQYRTNAIVKSETMQMEVYRQPERTGMDRREVFIDISDSYDGQTTDESESAWLLGKAKEVFAEYNVTVAFGSDVAPFFQFVYGVDYEIGDIVSVQNRYGFGGRCRVSEVVRSRDASGIAMTPTFIAVNENNEEVKN